MSYFVRSLESFKRLAFCRCPVWWWHGVAGCSGGSSASGSVDASPVSTCIGVRLSALHVGRQARRHGLRATAAVVPRSVCRLGEEAQQAAAGWQQCRQLTQALH